MTSALTPELFAARLKALTRDRVGHDAVPVALQGGAALADGNQAWVLLGPDGQHSLGAALAWARRHAGGLTEAEIDVVVDDADAAGVLARRAGYFARPPVVWLADGPDLTPAAPAPAVEVAPVPEADDLRAVLAEAGLDIVDDHGVVLGEMWGLEVARISDAGSGPVLDVGVGRFDRELTEMAHSHLAPADRLHRAVEIVSGYRRPGAEPHPLNQLVPERWMRTVLMADPGLVGAASLAPVVSAVPRSNLKDNGIASAVGVDLDGRPLVVACSTGVDLDLVPAAADDRAVRAPGARLVIAVPERDALPLTSDLAAALAQPAEVVPVTAEWRITWT